MYDERVRTIDWGGLIIKILLVAVVLFLILWLMPRRNFDPLFNQIFNQNLQTMKNAARNHYTIDKLPENVGESEQMSLQEMLDNQLLIPFVDKNGKACNTKDSYVHIIKVGDNEYKLKAQLTCGDETDYILETVGCNDVCANANKECEKCEECPVCEECEKPCDEECPSIVEYEHKKTVTSSTTSYTCPSGYSKVGDKCYTSTTSKTNATPVYGNSTVSITNANKNTGGTYYVYTDRITTTSPSYYYCASGTLSGSECRTNASYNGGTAGYYYCPSGWTLSGTSCYTNASYQSGSMTYYCPSGWTLSGTNCYRSASYVSGSTSYSCPSGWTLSGSSCYRSASYVNGSTSYSCPSGWTSSGSGASMTCSKSAVTNGTTYGSWYVYTTYSGPNTRSVYENTTDKVVLTSTKPVEVCSNGTTNCLVPQLVTYYYYTHYKRSATTNYTCSGVGGTLSGTICKQNASSSSSSGYYTCSGIGGSLSGSNCTQGASSNSSSGYYTCSGIGGSLSGSNCTQGASSNSSGGYYTCSGIGGSLSGSNCVQGSTGTATGSGYYCTSGTLSGSQCRNTASYNNGTGGSYSCASGWTLNGSTCSRSATLQNGTISYSCPSGYTPSGSGTNMVCYKIVKNNDTYYCPDAAATLKGDKCHKNVGGGIIGYTCPSGQKQEGAYCYVTANDKYIAATASTKPKTSTEYKWSTSRELDGWTATGVTRNIAGDCTPCATDNIK